MKILDRYILTSYLKTFFSVFIILMLIFILQSIWLYIKELAGKDLEFDVILKFLLYVSPRLIVLVLPLTILLSSIMVFGNFAEKYEFAAMKSTGISLQRAMRSLAVFIVGLSVLTFFFANNVIPKAEFNFYNLRKNIAKVKPAFAIAEGQFNQLGDLNIKVAKKSGERGQFLEEVIIHQKKPRSSGNHTVIIADRGELTSSEDSDILQMILYDGHYYDEVQPKKVEERQRIPHVKSFFETHTINIDLSYLEVDFEEQNITNKYTMLGIRDLNYTIDTLVSDKAKDYKQLSQSLYNRSTASTLSKNIIPSASTEKFKDSSFYSLFPDKMNIQLIDNALNNLKSSEAILSSKKKTFALKEKLLNKHIISFYEKFALAIACIILFFIGAPLGAIIKKGGFGLPIVIAIVLFLSYHFIGIFAKNSAEDSSLHPILATWLSTVIMLPLSIYLTNSATKDRPLVSLDGLLVPLRNWLGGINEENIQEEGIFEKSSEEYQMLFNSNDDRLIYILKNYRQDGLSSKYKYSALEVLKSRGITEQELKLGGNLVNENYEEALRHKRLFQGNSRVTLFFYAVALIGNVVGSIFMNNNLEIIGKILVFIGIPASLIYLLAFIRTFVNENNFYKAVGTSVNNNIALVIAVIFGLPLYFLYNIYSNRRMKEDLKRIR